MLEGKVDLKLDEATKKEKRRTEREKTTQWMQIDE